MAGLLNMLPGFRLVDGTLINSIIGVVNNLTGNGTPGPVTATNLTVSGNFIAPPQIITAAGSTQGGATAITSSLAVITVATTASTHGVRLPTASTGLEVEVGNAAAFGVKVYPATNAKIGAATTNSADTTVLAVNKINNYVAVNKTLWIVQRGA